MATEQNVLTTEMLRIRTNLEEGMLRIPYVDFVSVAFNQKDDRVMIIAIGTTRPDLVVNLINGPILRVIAEDPVLMLHIGDQHRWTPEFQILKGRTKST